MKKQIFLNILVIVGLVIGILFGLQYWVNTNNQKQAFLDTVEKIKSIESHQILETEDSESETDIKNNNEIIPELPQEERDEKSFQDFLKEIGGEEISKEEYNLITGSHKNLLYNFPQFSFKGINEEFNEDIKRKDNCLVFDGKIKHVEPLCDVYFEGTEVNDSFVFYNFVFDSRYYVIPTFKIEYRFNTLIEIKSGIKFDLESDFAEIDGLFIENHKFDPLNGAFISFSKNEIKEDGAYENIDLISWYDLGWDIYEVYNKDNFVYLSMYLTYDEVSLGSENLVYVKFDKNSI